MEWKVEKKTIGKKRREKKRTTPKVRRGKHPGDSFSRRRKGGGTFKAPRGRLNKAGKGWQKNRFRTLER